MNRRVCRHVYRSARSPQFLTAFFLTSLFFLSGRCPSAASAARLSATMPVLEVTCDSASSPSPSDTLYRAFCNPSRSARPRVWWHWMNGNITKDGISKDLHWMHDIGIVGFHNFDAGLETPQIVPRRLVYMTDEWKDAFRYALDVADSLDMEFTIASSPGWSETGGPWVSDDEGMKKLVWRQIDVCGGTSSAGAVTPASKLTPEAGIPVAKQSVAKQSAARTQSASIPEACIPAAKLSPEACIPAGKLSPAASTPAAMLSPAAGVITLPPGFSCEGAFQDDVDHHWETDEAKNYYRDIAVVAVKLSPADVDFAALNPRTSFNRPPLPHSETTCSGALSAGTAPSETNPAGAPIAGTQSAGTTPAGAPIAGTPSSGTNPAGAPIAGTAPAGTPDNFVPGPSSQNLYGMLNTDGFSDGVTLVTDSDGTAWAQYSFDEPQTIRGIVVSDRKTGGDRNAVKRELLCSDDGINFRKVAELGYQSTVQKQYSLPATRARHFRLNITDTQNIPDCHIRLFQFQLSSVATIQDAGDKAGFGLYRLIYLEDSQPSDQAARLEDVIDLTSKFHDGKLEWTVPEGRWRIFRFGYSLTGKTNHPASPEATGLEVDKLDPVAIDRYYRNYLETYRDASGNRLGCTVPANDLSSTAVASASAPGNGYTPVSAHANDPSFTAVASAAAPGNGYTPVSAPANDLSSTAVASAAAPGNGCTLCSAPAAAPCNFHRVGTGGISYMLTDSYEAGIQTWTPRMPEEFFARKGYDLIPWLPALTGLVLNNTAETERFLFDWRRCIGSMMAEYHYDLQNDVLADYGMKRYTESHENYRANLTDGMDCKRKAHVPMSAFWMGYKQGSIFTPRFEADIRESASVAHIYGQNVAAAESFTSSGTRDGAWVYSPAILKPTADAAMSSGLNRFVIHCSPHQPVDDKQPGLGLGIYGQWFDRHDTWSAQADAWVSYLSRSCELLQKGRFVADIAVYYGEDNNLTGIYLKSSPDVPAGYSFDYFSPSVLLELAKARDGRIVIPSGLSYRALHLGCNVRHVSLPVLRKLKEFADAGVPISGNVPEALAGNSDLCDGRPVRLDSAEAEAEFAALVDDIWHSGRANVQCGGNSLAQLLASGTAPDFIAVAAPVASSAGFPGAGSATAPGSTAMDKLRFVHRKLDEGEIYWIANLSDSTCAINASFRTSGFKPMLWHAEDASAEELSYRFEDGRTVIPLTLTAYQSVFVVFNEKTEQRSFTLPDMHEDLVSSFPGSWSLTFQQKRGAPDGAEMKELKSLSECSEDGIRYFSGEVTYTKTFGLTRKDLSLDGRFILDLGAVADLAEVSVNGIKLGTVWHSPYRLDITSALQKGTNTLEVKVVNTWHNRIVGDMQPGVVNKVSYYPIDLLSADEPLLPAGLIGPVKLILQY